jgi:hypothetical protein
MPNFKITYAAPRARRVSRIEEFPDEASAWEETEEEVLDHYEQYGISVYFDEDERMFLDEDTGEEVELDWDVEEVQ